MSVPFMTSTPPNPFAFSDPNFRMKGAGRDEFSYVAEAWVNLQAQFNHLQSSKRWALECLGPGRVWSAGEQPLISEVQLNSLTPAGPTIFGYWGYGCPHGATNGTLSKGDIVRVGP